MSKKAVYNNKGLAIYITGDDFKDLLERTTLSVPVYIGKVKTQKDFTVVRTLSGLDGELAYAYQLEHEAIESVRRDAEKSKVSYLTTEEVSRRLKNG